MIRTYNAPIRLFSLSLLLMMAAPTGGVAMDGMAMDHSGREMNMRSPSAGNASMAKGGQAAPSPVKAMSRGQPMGGMGTMSDMDDMDGMSDMEGMGDMDHTDHRTMPPHPARKASGPARLSGPAGAAGKAGRKPGLSPDAARQGKKNGSMEGGKGMAMSSMAGMAMPPGTSVAGSAARKPRIVHKAVDAPAPVVDLGHHMHGMDMGKWFHGVLDEFEGRYQGGGNSSLRWDGEAWYGGDYNRLWLKSEGTMTRGRVRDGDQELLYSRAVSSYFNLQGGVRLDLDSGPTRAWGAVGVEGLALYQFEVQATGYFNDRGVAGRLEGSYDILLTNRLILQPQVELNFYSHADRQRLVGSGLADIDTGLRLRYELWRKMAPYVAVTYDSPLMQGRHMARQQGERASEARFTFGIRSWF